MLDVVNVVGSGCLVQELDLSAAADDLGTIAEFDPEKYPGMYVRLSDEAPLVTVYRTGKFIVSGAESEKELNSTKDRFIHLLSEKDIINKHGLDWFNTQNLVCTTELSKEFDLNALAIELGFENTEYEPEQFPGLVYRYPDLDCVILIFSTGKAVITGSSDYNEVETAHSYIKDKLSNIQMK